jgi:hypothetical protein
VTFLEALLVGLDEARRHLGQTALSLLGLVLGTASIVTVLALFGGQTRHTQEYIAEVGGYGTIIARDRELAEQPTARELASERLTYRDAAYLKQQATMLAAVAPGWYRQLEYRVGEVDFLGEVIGTTPDYAVINDIRPLVGRYLSALDVELEARAAVLGWQYADSLFGSPEAALGRTVQLGGRNFTVVGVLIREEFYLALAPWSGNELEYRNRRAYIPITTGIVQFDGTNDRLSFLTLKAVTPTGARAATAQVRALLLQRHGVEDFDSGRRGLHSHVQLHLPRRRDRVAVRRRGGDREHPPGVGRGARARVRHPHGPRRIRIPDLLAGAGAGAGDRRCGRRVGACAGRGPDRRRRALHDDAGRRHPRDGGGGHRDLAHRRRRRRVLSGVPGRAALAGGGAALWVDGASARAS